MHDHSPFVLGGFNAGSPQFFIYRELAGQPLKKQHMKCHTSSPDVQKWHILRFTETFLENHFHLIPQNHRARNDLWN